MRNKCNLMKKNQIEFKKLLSVSMLVKFSFFSFLNKGRVQILFATGRNLFKTCGEGDENADLKKFCFLFGSYKFFFWRNTTLNIDVQCFETWK